MAITANIKPPQKYNINNGWLLIAILVAIFAALPILSIIWLAFNPTENIWPHLFDTVLWRYIKNTLILMFGVGLSTIIIGVASAWLVTMCRFPGVKFFEWALLLPIAVPAYVIAYVYTDILDYSGALQIFLRDIFGWQLKSEYYFPEIRSHGGAIAMLSLVLYPYVYMLSRASFIQQSICLLEAGRVLGRSPWQCFFTIAIPLARPALVVGLSLVLMETLNDFGTIDFFGIHTLTAGVFDIWMLQGNLGGAAQIALVMLFFVAGLLWIERRSRKSQRYSASNAKYNILSGYKLHGWKVFAAMCICSAPILLGFIVPSGILTYYALNNWQASLSIEFFTYAKNSLFLATTAAIITIIIGFLLAYAMRLHKINSNGHRNNKRANILNIMVRFASVGYAMPGAVLAIGVLVPFALIDNSFDTFMRAQFNISTGLILSGTAFAIIFAYVVRFLAVGLGAVETSLTKVTPNMDDAARSLGASAYGCLKYIHIPMIRSGILAGAILVFVDAMKELPATLILRPFNFDTLATYVYQFASDELLEQSALGALTIVVTGILPVILLSHAIRKSRPGSG